MGEGFVIAFQFPAGVAGIYMQQAFLGEGEQRFFAYVQRLFRLFA